MLEEYGYETTIENLEILKEDIAIVTEARREVRDAAKAVLGSKKPVSELGKLKSSNPELYHRTMAHLNGKTASAQLAKAKEYDDAMKKSGLAGSKIADIGNARTEKAADAMLTGRAHKERAKKLAEEYSDYELYQILDESGFKPTASNLDLLKEGLETGKYEIVNEEVPARLKGKKLRPAKNTERYTTKRPETDEEYYERQMRPQSDPGRYVRDDGEFDYEKYNREG